MSEKTYLTPEGFNRLKAELDELKTKGRKEAANAIQKAREMGDLSENAEYDAAKDAQGLLEMRIAKLETTIANSRIISTQNLDDGKVYILSTVTVKNLKTNAVMSYTLVAEEEADLKLKKLSVKSPVGKALLGKEKGDVIDVKIPAGTIQFEIQDISMDM